VAAGIDVTLVVPARWTGSSDEITMTSESFRIIELGVRRAGDVNRHAYTDDLEGVLRSVAPDILDIHEEPLSIAARQWLRAAPAGLPVVMYTAQNVDKRLPPPFGEYERAAHRRVAALYPCSAQAAAVARGKGFDGLIDVLPLGYDDALFIPGCQSLDEHELVLGLFGRLVREKGVLDSVDVLARLQANRAARLVVVGAGPEEAPARSRAAELGVAQRLDVASWQPAAALAEIYRRTHVVLVPSRATLTWVEQFGRVIVEAQASGAVVAGYASGSIGEVGGDAAVLTPAGDVAELGERVCQLLGDSEAFTQRREQGLALSPSRTWGRVAERQADLYHRLARREVGRIALPSSPRARRVLAQAEFGPTASTLAGRRPFALPLLRRGGFIAEGLSAICDATAEAGALAGRTRSHRLR
jgi:glycosyltransferase involved in cell wall biosynthesis